jgi:hypothetical protein
MRPLQQDANAGLAVWSPAAIYIPIPRGVYESIKVDIGGQDASHVRTEIARGDGLVIVITVQAVQRYSDVISGEFAPWMCTSDPECSPNPHYIRLTEAAFGGPISSTEMKVKALEVEPDDLACRDDSFGEDAVLMALLNAKSGTIYFPAQAEFEFQLVGDDVGIDYATASTRRTDEPNTTQLVAEYDSGDYDIFWSAKGNRSHLTETRSWLPMFTHGKRPQSIGYVHPAQRNRMSDAISEVPLP